MRPIDADGFLDRNAEFANREFIHPKYQATLRELVDSEPTLSPDDVRGVGEWIEDAGGNYLVCPECKYDHALYDRLGYSCEHEYCPFCGKHLIKKSNHNRLPSGKVIDYTYWTHEDSRDCILGAILTERKGHFLLESDIEQWNRRDCNG